MGGRLLEEDAQRGPAILCGPPCNPMCPTLQPYVSHPATLWAGGALRRTRSAAIRFASTHTAYACSSWLGLGLGLGLANQG